MPSPLGTSPRYTPHEHDSIPNLHHRKIELQSPLDLTYLRQNIESAAHEKINLNLPIGAVVQTGGGDSGSGEHDERVRKESEDVNATVEKGEEQGGDRKRRRTGKEDGERVEVEDGQSNGDEDPLRVRVRDMVQEFLDQTFTFAGHSISINGIDIAPTDLPVSKPASSSIQEFTALHDKHLRTDNRGKRQSQPREHKKEHGEQEEEKEGIHFNYAPHDPSLSTKLASLYADLERETLAVSRLRRTAPAKGAKDMGELLVKQIEKEHNSGVNDSADVENQQNHDCGEKGRILDLNLTRKNIRDDGDGKNESDGVDIAAIPFEETRATYERGLMDLYRLGGGSSANLDNIGDANNSPSRVASSDGEQRQSTTTTTTTLGLTEAVGKVQRAVDVVRVGFGEKF